MWPVGTRKKGSVTEGTEVPFGFVFCDFDFKVLKSFNQLMSLSACEGSISAEKAECFVRSFHHWFCPRRVPEGERSEPGGGIGPALAYNRAVVRLDYKSRSSTAAQTSSSLVLFIGCPMLSIGVSHIISLVD